MKEQIAVLIGDIVGSKKIEDREEVQRNLERVLSSLEKDKESKGLISEPSIIRGDEFEIAFKNAERCYLGFREIEHQFRPNKIWGGIGVGELNTEVRKSTSEMDGPAFHRARKALEDAKSGKEEPLFLISCEDKKFEENLNILLRLIYSIKNDWTKREREFAEYYLSGDEKVTHKEISNHFGVSRSNVSRTLSKGHISAIEKAEKYVLERLSELEGG